MVADTQGKEREIAKDLRTKGTLAWRPSGQEILFDRDERGQSTLCAVSLDGRLRSAYSSIDWLFLEDVAADGSVLVERWTTRSSTYFRRPGDVR